MRKSIIFITVLFSAVFAVTPCAKAMPVDPVSLWVYDQAGPEGDGQITFAVSNFDYSGNPVPATLEYKVDDLVWLPIIGNIQVINIPGVQHRLTFRLVPDSSEPIAEADMLFQGPEDIYFGCALMNWKDYPDLSCVTVEDDRISAVPVPAALWLFGSGLLGLLGIKRKLG